MRRPSIAVVALSESLAYDLAGTPVGVSVLAPAAVKTRIYVSGENRPDRFGGPYQEPGNIRCRQEVERDGIEPDEVGERVVRAIRGRELYVFTHMETKDWLLVGKQLPSDATPPSSKMSQDSRKALHALQGLDDYEVSIFGSGPPKLLLFPLVAPVDGKFVPYDGPYELKARCCLYPEIVSTSGSDHAPVPFR